MMSAAEVVDPEAFATLVAHAETRRSLSGFLYTDYRATYTSAEPGIDVNT